MKSQESEYIFNAGDIMNMFLFYLFSPWIMIPYWMTLPFTYWGWVVWMWFNDGYKCDTTNWYGIFFAALIAPVCQYGM